MMKQKKIHTEIIYEDPDILVCIKPAGVAVQTAKAGAADMISELKNYRAKNHQDPYIGLIHRLDQPVKGIMVFAKTKQAAAVLSRQVSSRQITKEYLAVVCSSSADNPSRLPSSGQLCNWLLRDGKTNTSKVVSKDTPGAKEAILSYEVLQTCPGTGRSLIRITLHTGRHHQIRVQFSHAGFPLYADTKYGQPLPQGSYCPIALCSCKIAFTHPKTGKPMEFSLSDDCLDALLTSDSTI